MFSAARNLGSWNSADDQQLNVQRGVESCFIFRLIFLCFRCISLYILLYYLRNENLKSKLKIFLNQPSMKNSPNNFIISLPNNHIIFASSQHINHSCHNDPLKPFTRVDRQPYAHLYNREIKINSFFLLYTQALPYRLPTSINISKQSKQKLPHG